MIKKFLGKDWFFEDFLPDEPKKSTFGFQIEKVIYSGKSEFQEIKILENEDFGKVLILDGMVQLATKFEYIYHEMLIHPVMLYHKNPQRILILGGGDGGALREVIKYPVKEIYLVEIDQKVIEVSEKYLSSISKGAFKDKRVKILVEDAFKFLDNFTGFFDIIVEDLTDPKGPSLLLWKKKFYQKIVKALSRKGLVSMQVGYLREKFSRKIRSEIKEFFPYSILHRAFVNCFPMDEHVFLIGSTDFNFTKKKLNYIKQKFQRLKVETKYYNPKIHFCSKIEIS
jgi:spermidine synthase